MSEENLNNNVDEVKEVEEQDTLKESTQEETKKEKTFTRDDVAKMIAAETSKAKSEWEKEQAEREQEAAKLAKMNAQEKSEHEKKLLEEKIADFERKENLYAMTKEATRMLSEHELIPSDELLSIVVKDNADDTKASVNVLVSEINKQAERLVKERNTGVTPTKYGSTQQTVTKEEYDRMSFVEKATLQKKNPEIFNQITGGN